MLTDQRRTSAKRVETSQSCASSPWLEHDLEELTLSFTLQITWEKAKHNKKKKCREILLFLLEASFETLYVELGLKVDHEEYTQGSCIYTPPWHP